MMSWWNRKHKLAARISCLKRSFKGFRNSTLVGGKTELGFWMEGNEVERRRFLVRALRLRSEGDKLGIKVNGWEHSPLQWRRSVFEHSHSHLARFLVITRATQIASCNHGSHISFAQACWGTLDRRWCLAAAPSPLPLSSTLYIQGLWFSFLIFSFFNC